MHVLIWLYLSLLTSQLWRSPYPIRKQTQSCLNGRSGLLGVLFSALTQSPAAVCGPAHTYLLVCGAELSFLTPNITSPE